MLHGHPTYGLAKGEKPPLVHRLSAISGRAYCGRPVEVLPRRANDRGCRCAGGVPPSTSRDTAGLPAFEEIF